MTTKNQLLITVYCIFIFPLFTTAQNLDTILFDLPLFIINTNGQGIPNEPKLDAYLGIINNPNGINYYGDEFTEYDGHIGIEIRGNGSANWSKKSYLFETRKSDGSNLNISLLGMPKENDWILYAPYIDRTGMRNVLTYELAREMGHYSSRTAYCELIINGEYKGVYVLAEKIKRDDNRVAVPKFEDDSAADEGGYIIRTDSWWNETVGWLSSNLYEIDGKDYWPRYQYVYPKFDDITSEQKAFIQDYMLAIDEAFYHAPTTDYEYLYSNLIDLNSFVDLFIINELTQNPDGYRLSTYMYLDPTLEQFKLNMGPVWDCNVCYGNYYQRFGVYPEGWDYDNDFWEVNVSIPFWWRRLMADDTFKKRLINRWEELRNTLITVEAFNERIDFFDEKIKIGMERNHSIWPEEQITLDLDWASTNSYETDVEMLRQWISDRIDWIDQELAQMKKPWIESSIKVYPNPIANPSFNVSFYLDIPTNIQFQIYDFSGKMILSGTANGAKGQNDLAIDNFHAPAGTYVLELIINNKRFTQKLVRL